MKSEHRIVFRRGEKVYLRPVIEEDLPILTVHINDEETSLFLTVDRPMSPAQEQAWFERTKETDKNIIFAVVEVETDEIVGTIGLHNIKHLHGTATLGCALRKKFWKKGYGSEAGVLIVEYAFNTLNLRKLTGEAFAFNARSIALQKKVGFHEEGVLKKQLYRNGEYHDIVQLALFKEDWKQSI